MPSVPLPDELPSETDIAERFLDKLPENLKSYWQRERPIEMRLVEFERYLKRDKRPARAARLDANPGPLPDDPRIHQCVLAYASDFTLLDTALVPHGKLMFDTDIQLASLDHALWFHRPFRADEWLLYAQDSPSASGARGFCRGSVFSRDGTLVASRARKA